MKHFIKQGLLFLFLGVLIFSFINDRYRHSHGFRNSMDIEKYDAVPDHIEIANVGSSHGTNSFVYDDLPLLGYNFAYASQNFHYDLLVLQQFEEHFAPGAILIVPVSYPSFGTTDMSRQDYIYYQFLRPGLIDHFCLEDYLKYKLFPVLTAEEKLIWLIYDEEEREPEWDSIDYNMHMDDMEEVAQKKAQDFKNVGFGDTRSILDLRELLTYIDNQGWEAMLVTTPVTWQLNQHFSASFREEFETLISGLAEEYDVSYYDYSQDERFETQMQWFRNADHLNTKGRAYFSEIFFRESLTCQEGARDGR